MFCSNCGSECQAEYIFCRNCGAPVGAGIGQAAVATISVGPATQPAASWQPVQAGPAAWNPALSAPPAYRLYDASAVAMAALFGGSIAGTILMALNDARLGKVGKGLLEVVLGVIGTALVILVGWNQRAGSSALGVVLFVCTWQAARIVQSKDVEGHIARGGRLGSRWLAFGIGIATLAVLFGVVFAVAYHAESSNRVIIGTKDEVFYSGTATKDDATALGNALKKDGFFQDRGVTVLIDKGTGGTVISFVVQDGYWNEAGVLPSFEEIAREVAASVGGLPVQVHLVDSNKTVEKATAVGEVDFGGSDAVIYEGAATLAQAQAIGQQFKTLGFFTGHGANVFLTKHDDGTTLAFVVADGAWNDAGIVRDFEKIVRAVAPSAGGLPIEMHLVSTQLVVGKDEQIK